MFLHDLAQVARWIIPDKLESQHSLHPLDILSLSREVIRLIRMVHKKKQPCNGLRSYSFCAFYMMWKRDALWPALTRQTKEGRCAHLPSLVCRDPLEDRFARVRIEEVNIVGIDMQVDSSARMCARMRIETCNQRFPSDSHMHQ